MIMSNTVVSWATIKNLVDMIAYFVLNLLSRHMLPDFMHFFLDPEKFHVIEENTYKNTFLEALFLKLTQ